MNSDNIFKILLSNLEFAKGGLHPDILNEFPAQCLIRVRFDITEPVDWKTFWPANGGTFFRGRMIALKWDPVWWKISFLNLPVAPFQRGSGYDLEDVDRDDAERFGLLTRATRPPALKLDIDLADIKSRLAEALAKTPG